MKVVIQRSLHSKVEVESQIVGEIDKGMVLLVCLEKGDDLQSVEKAATKIGKLRIFEDPKTKKMGMSINQIGGQFLAILGQFEFSGYKIPSGMP